MKTRLFSVAFISILLVMVLSTFVLAVDKEVLSFSSRLWSPPAEQEFIIEYVIKPFEKENNCIVNFQILDDKKLLERAELQLKTDHPTMDIVCAYVANMAEWIEEEYIEDLTSYVKSWDDRTFSKTFEYGTNFEGKQYFIPVGADVYLTIANKKAVKYFPVVLTWIS